MKKTILKLSVIILMTVLMLLIPPTANAETNYKFDYSQIKALEGQTQKYYEIDPEDGIIESQSWHLISDNIYDSTSKFMPPNSTFEVGKKYRYVAKIKLTEKYDFAEVTNLPIISGASSTVSIDGDCISIEIIAVVPKKFSVTVNMSDGILNSTKSYDVYEMEELNFDIGLAEGYEVESITANGNHILGGSSYFEDTFAEMINNKVRVWNINTNVDIEIVTRQKIEVEPEKVEITMNEVNVGDKITDLKFYIKDELFKVTEIEVGELKEIDNELEYTPIEGVFENGKKYGVIIHLISNVGEWYDGEVAFYMNEEELVFESVSTTKFSVAIILPELEDETPADSINPGNQDNILNKEEKDETPADSINPGNQDNILDKEEKDEVSADSVNSEKQDNISKEKDDTPKTGNDFNLLIILLGISVIGVLATSKKRE